MKRFLTVLVVIILSAVLMLTANAEQPDQVVNAGGSVLYNANGTRVSGTNLGDNGSVVKVSKTIEPYQVNGANVENEFVVTLQVQTSQELKQITADTPDSAVLLVMDVSNSMDDCVNCGKEANHTDHSGTSTTTYYCSGTSGNTYNTIFGTRCILCFKTRSQHNAVTVTTSGSCAYLARLAATKVAAEDFISEFAAETGAQSGDKRMVAVVAYGSHAVRVLDWVDVTTTDGMDKAHAAIQNLSIANNNSSSDLRGGGTNIEGGLVLARNVLGESAVSNIDYCYTVMLTDGQPTYPVRNADNSSTTSVLGYTSSSYNGDSTERNEIDDVAAVAQAIRSKSKLYSICFGKSDNQDVWDLKPFGSWSGNNPYWSTNGNTKIGDWLTSFSTTAYKAADASSAQLFDTFSSILTQIQIAAKAWKVADWMGDYAIYNGPVTVQTSNGGYVNNNITTTPDAADYPNGVPDFQWDLLTSETDPAITNWDAATETGVLGYTYKYRVTLDNLDALYSTTDGDEENPRNPSTAVNKDATLVYVTTDEEGNWPTSDDEYKTVDFPAPEVKGLMLSKLVFEKVDEKGNPLPGFTFRLRANEYSLDEVNADDWDYVDATSDANGIVTFTGIPSGHTYTLLEAEKPANSEHYLDAGDYTVDIQWGNVVSMKNGNGALSDGDDADNYVELVNEYKKDELGKLTLKKYFAAGSDIPHSIRFEITGPNNFHVFRELNAADEQADGSWQWTMTGLEFGAYTVREINAIDAQGNRLRDTHNLVYSIKAKGETKANNQTFVAGQNEPVVEFDLLATDPAKTAVVEFTNSMTRKQGTLAISKTFVDLPANLVNGNMGLDMKVIATPVNNNDTAINGASPVTLTLNWNGAGYVASAKLPIGRYKLTEEIRGTVPDYSLLHYAFEQNGADIGNGIVTVEDNKTLNVTLKNHYERDHGHIYIYKAFDGDLTADHFQNRMFTVNVHENDRNGKIVATMTLENVNGTWRAESPLLPVGTYYLEEVVAAGAEGTAYENGYTHLVGWNPGATVQVTKEAMINITLINTYSQHVGNIKLTKSFAGDLTAAAFANKTIEVQILHNNVVMDTLTISGNQLTDTSIELPAGEYQLVEVGAEVDNYGVTQTWTNLKPGTKNTVVVDEGKTTEVGLTNTYSQHKGNIRLNKAFAGELTANDFMDKTISVQILQNNVVVDTLTISGNQQTDLSAALPVGEYQLVEVGAEVANHHLTQSWKNVKPGTTNTVVVEDGKTTEVSLTNTYSDHIGYIKLTKAFSGDLSAADFVGKTITVQILQNNVVVDTLTISGNQLTDTSIALPVGEYQLVEHGAEVDKHNLVQTWTNVKSGTTNTVVVTEGTTTEVSLTNNYTTHIGHIKLVKKIAGDLRAADFAGKTISVQILQNNVVVDTLTISGNHLLDTSIALPVGEYQLVEVGAEVDNYGVTQTWTNLKPGTRNTVVVAEGKTTEVGLTNTYSHHMGNIKLTKSFAGDLSAADFAGKDISVQILQNNQVVDVLRFSGNHLTDISIALPVGEYQLVETGAEMEKYTLSQTWTNLKGGTTNTVVVADGKTTEVGLTNTYKRSASVVTVKIPVEKTVTVSGNVVPEKTTFSFGAEWNSNLNNLVTVSFQNELGNLIGRLEQSGANSYTITVDGEGTVKGYIVISGYADDLNNFELTTWEKLAPYANAMEAAENHWNFDQTALNSALRWRVTLKQENAAQVSSSIALGQTAGQAAIAYENVYTEVEEPELPETGDRENVMFYMMLLGISVSGLVLLRKKYSH